jgi:hypothetical protein
MKRLLVLISAAVVLGVILGGFTLVGHTATTKAAGPFTISMVSYPGEPASGVTGSTTIVDTGTGAVLGIATANGIAGFTQAIPSVPPEPTNVAVLYFSAKYCVPSALVAILVYHPTQADQNIFLTDGVQLGALDGSTVVIKADNSGIYPDPPGAASILSAELANLTHFDSSTLITDPSGAHAFRKADVNHLACGNADGTPIVDIWAGVGGLRTGVPGPASTLDTLNPIPGDNNGDTVVDSGDASLSIDMVQDAGGTWCNPIDATGTETVPSDYTVAVCLTSAGPGNEPNAFGFELHYNPQLNACQAQGANCSSPNLDCNPDANTGASTSSTPSLGNVGYDCSGVGAAPPTCDAGKAYLGCFTTGTPTLNVGNTVSAPIAVVNLHALAVGVDNLTLENVSVTSTNFGGDLVDCPGPPGFCFGATDNKELPAPTATFTPTNTPLPATNTPTATPVPAGVRMEKVAPNGSSNPALANLWLMKGPCTPANALLGKGCLELDEWIYAIADVDDPNDADDLPEGLGAWENQIRFDHKFISLTKVPDTTWLFSNGRWGGPVVPNPTPGGPDLVSACYITILSEDNILEGCVSKDDPNTAGIQTGPQGQGLIERIYIVPNINDLVYRSDFRPTKDNGILTDIVDDNCEVTDIYGEQIPGTLPGQLTTVCGDAHITIRMLECDLNLDCQVNVTDDQMEAFRYGSHLGLQLYDRWYDMEPKWSDDDIDIKDLQFCFGRNYSTCENPIPDDQATPVAPHDP